MTNINYFNIFKNINEKINLSKYPKLKVKVKTKRQKLQKKKEECKNVLETFLPLDVIKYCIHIYI